MPKPSPILIRAYEPDDAPLLADLRYRSVHQLGGPAYSSEQLNAWVPAVETAQQVRARCEDGRSVWQAVTQTDQLVGSIDLEPATLDGHGHIDYLYVDPLFARQGIAGRLIDHVIDVAKDRRMIELFTEASELARPVFASREFELEKRRDFELRGVIIHNYGMRLVLSA